MRDRNECQLEIRDYGLKGYDEALSLQKELVEKRQKGKISNTVLILEHPAVITLGARRDLNELLVDKEVLSAGGIEVVSIRRGGGTTAHNPGQVILYPVLHLRSLGLGVGQYVRQLEIVGIELLGRLGVIARRRKGFVGLWVDEKKIGSIGVRLKRWVTYHGMAVNIQNDLSIFDTIVPCGLEGVQITSVQKETGRQNSMDEVKRILSELCRKYWAK